MNADERARKKAEPMYSCRNEHCATEISYPADLLRIHPDDTLVCQDCWEDGENEGDQRGWTELPAFISHKQALTEARTAALREAAEVAREHGGLKCGWGAANGIANAIETLIDNPDSKGK